MKTIISYLFPLFVVSLLFTSCQKDNIVGPDDDDVPVVESFFSCKFNGEAFTSTGLLAYGVRPDDSTDDHYGIYGTSSLDATETVMYIQVRKDLGVGTHELEPDVVYSLVSLSDGSSWTTELGDASGTVTILEKTANRVKGTFQFTITSFDDYETLMEVSEGEFNVELR